MPRIGLYELGRVKVAVWRIDETESELLSVLPQEYSGEIFSMKSAVRRLEWLAVRVLLADIFGQEARIVYNSAGKPLLDGAALHIGISHTKGYAVLAFSESPFGVDAELLDRNILSIAGRLCSCSEDPFLDDAGANGRLLLKWCACEAMFKLVGNLGGTYRDNVVVSPPALSGCGSFPVLLRGVVSSLGRDYTADYLDTGGLLLVVCTPLGDPVSS